MDQQNQTADSSVDNDLQKAIDNITNNTNVDPVFSDPVAAPSSIPEGDTGELSEPVGPFPEPKVEMVGQDSEPIAPLEAAADIPDLSATTESAPEPTSELTPDPTPTPEPTIAPSTESLSTHQIKEAALRDLVPLLDHLDITPSQKFKIYRNIFEELKDYSVLEPAYKVAKEVSDETERAKDLLYLVEAIDKM